MKNIILLILAMLFAFAMPVQASEGWEGFAPVQSSIGSGSGDVIGPKVTDDKVTSARTMRQLEAADLYLLTVIKDANDFTGWSTVAPEPEGQGAVHEVGWRA
jgi:hypothetical protein